MIKRRIIPAVLVTVLSFGFLLRDAIYGTSWGFSLIILLGTVVVMREYCGMVRAKGFRPLAIFGTAAAVLLVLAHDLWCWQTWHGLPRSTPDVMIATLALAVLGTALLQGVRRSPENAIPNIATTLFGLVYVWFLPSFLIKIRHLGVPGGNSWQWDGVELVIATIFIAKMSDVGGLLVGKCFGKHKLTPVISPNKTWEGTFGGICASIAVGLYMKALAPQSVLGALGWGEMALFCVLMAVSSLLGDLFESVLKRDSECKDSGGYIPGFGGLLDMVDSLMVSAPAAYFYFVLLGARPALS
jgi:phosphatidate cytidylyltransferase